MKRKNIFSITFLLMVLIGGLISIGSCTESERDLYGSISGIVTDAETGGTVSGVSVAISPQGDTRTTGSDGTFSFIELAPTDYTLTFTKDGYITDTRVITVQAGIDSRADKAIMPIHPQLGVSKEALDFETETTSLTLDISNTGNGVLKWEITENIGWLTCSATAGETEKEISSITITVSREGLKRGTYTEKLAITSNGGSAEIAVSMEVSGSDLAITPDEIDLGETGTTAQLTLTNRGKGTLDYKAQVSNEWMSLSKTEGKVTTEDYITLTVNRSALDAGEYSGQITFSVGEEQIIIPVKLTVPVKSIPTISLDQVKNVAYNGATLSGTIVSVGYSKITRYGFCWSSTSEEPVLEETNFTDMGDCSTPMAVEGTITGLETETKYYVRLYAENNEGIAYSNALSFTTTKLPALATVETREMTDVAGTTATANGAVTHLGNVTKVSQHGHIWGETKELTVKLSTKTELGELDAPASFSSELTGLSLNHDYYVRAYATNEKGTAYGEVIPFKTTTGDLSLPALAAVSVSGVTTQGATLQSRITDEGKGTISDCGFCWSTNPEPTIEQESISCKPSGNVFGTKLEGLKDGTKYYVRAYAVNELGAGYSETVEFTTTKVELPTWGTVSVSNVGKTKADVAATLTSDGNAAITEMGVCWSTQPEATIYDTKLVCPTGDRISTQVTGLQGLTTYYLRAYAQNSAGIAYSEEVSFTTTDSEVDIWDGTSVASQFAGGSGTQSDPIRIETAAQLKLLADKVNSGTTYAGIYFRLESNISLANKNWTPIGSEYVFSGHFDGNNNQITEMRVTTDDNHAGLFGSISGGSVSNLKVGGQVKSTNRYSYVGMICGNIADATIENVETFGNVEGEWNVGGIIGYVPYETKVQVNNSINRCNVSGSLYVGGIAGGGSRSGNSLNGDIFITNCINYGDIAKTGNTDAVGGIIGGHAYTEIHLKNCCNYSNVAGYGIRGNGNGASTVINCFWLNDISGDMGTEAGFNYQEDEYENFGYFTRSSSSCTLIQLGGKDLVDELNRWVNENDPSTYRRWKYETVNGYACPVLE